MKLKFEDKNEYQGTTHYPVANESVRRWREVLKDVKVKVAAGIAGGGEISFFGILPSVSEKLVLVDHSYVSLWALVGKYGTIETLGPEKAVKLLQMAPATVHGGGYNEAGKRVKGGLYNRYGEMVDNNPFSHKLVGTTQELYSCFLAANKGTPTETDRMEECGWWPLHDMHTRWGEITVEDCEGLLKSEVDLQVYHGDISDLVEHAPVELLYLSNALQYNGRNGKDFKLGEIVQKGALLAYTGSAGYHDPYAAPRRTGTAASITISGLKCKPVEVVKPKRATATKAVASASQGLFPAPVTVYDGAWTYSLAEVL